MKNRKITAILQNLIAFSLVFMFSNLCPVTAQQKPFSVNKTIRNTSSPAEPDQPKFALLVGITTYDDTTINKIDGCENNVPLLKQTLVKNYGFDEKNVLPLINQQATRDEIISKFRSHLIANADQAKKQGKEAVILYYFCGHGSQYPDQDKDENDRKDETFLSYDSRTANVFDILDDEIDDLKAELRPFTSNTTLILESCHSGTASRGDEIYISEEALEDNRVRPPYKRKFPPTKDADALTYTEIAASSSIRTALSETAKSCNCEKPQSLMTKALIEGLNRAPQTINYRSLVREIAVEVARKSPQEPQVEGNVDALLFGGAAKRANPYIEIDKILPNSVITIKAGKVHGLKVGSQVSIYSSNSVTHTGTKNWLANGIVKQVGNFESLVQLPKEDENPQVKEIKVSSHAVLASPVFGGGAVFVALNPNAVRALDVKDASLNKEIETGLNNDGLIESQMVKLVASDNLSGSDREDSRGIIRLRKEKIIYVKENGKVTKFILTPGSKIPADESKINFKELPPPINVNLVAPPESKTFCEGNVLKTAPTANLLPPEYSEVYYLDEGEAGGAPLFGKIFEAGDKELASKIVTTIRGYILQNNLRSLDNSASTLSAKVKASLQIYPGILGVACESGKKKYNKSTLGKDQELKGHSVSVERYFWLNIKNISGEKRRQELGDNDASGESYHIAVLALKNTGDIEIVHSSSNADDPLEDGREIDRLKNVLFRAKYPVGAEHYVIVISKRYVDFSFYEIKGAKRASKDILETILTQSGQRTRDSRSIVNDDPDQWSVIHIDLNVTEKD